MKPKLAFALVAALAAGCARWAPHDDRAHEVADDEVPVALDAVPAVVMAAAKAAVPGVVFTAAEQETEDGTVVYCLEGTADGKPVEVEVTEAGQVLEIEHDEDDED